MWIPFLLSAKGAWLEAKASQIPLLIYQLLQLQTLLNGKLKLNHQPFYFIFKEEAPTREWVVTLNSHFLGKNEKFNNPLRTFSTSRSSPLAFTFENTAVGKSGLACISFPKVCLNPFFLNASHPSSLVKV